MNDWDRIVIRSMQRACDGTSEGVKKSWETRKHGGGSPQMAHSNTHEGVTSMLKGMLENLKRKAMPGKYTTTTKHTPGTSKRDPKTGNIQQTAGRTETVSRPKPKFKSSTSFKPGVPARTQTAGKGPRAKQPKASTSAPKTDRHGQPTSGSVASLNKHAEENS